MSSITPPSSDNPMEGLQGSNQNTPPPTNFKDAHAPSDPTGVWQKFLSTPGHPATPKETQKFIDGLFRQLGNQIAHELKRAKEQARKERRAAEGQ